jgi:uncharacterized Zn finger protein
MATSKKKSASRPSFTETALRRAAGQVIFERADEYVCSEALTRRLVAKNTLSAQVYGNYGVYRVRLEVSSRGGLTASCTCPAEMDFCKHAAALGRTWLAEPESFFDLESLRQDLEGRSREELVELVLQMAAVQPAVLSVFGIEGFDEEQEPCDDSAS